MENAAMEHSLVKDDLLAYRSEFPILGNTTYLISNSLGAMPRAVYAAMHPAK